MLYSKLLPLDCRNGFVSWFVSSQFRLLLNHLNTVQLRHEKHLVQYATATGRFVALDTDCFHTAFDRLIIKNLTSKSVFILVTCKCCEVLFMVETVNRHRV
jgi:hypothetical protein